MTPHVRTTNNDGTEFLTIFLPNQAPLVASSAHANYHGLIEALRDGASEDEITDLYDVGRAVERTFRQITERVAVRNGTVYFDGDAQHSAIADQILDALTEDQGAAAPLVNFMEKLAANPSKSSREQLFEWLDRHEFTILPNGDVLAYKGVSDGLKSLSRGPATVDGVAQNGNIPNEIGSVIELARSEVEDNSFVGCAAGLHVGTWEYASTFGPHTLEVAVNPRDIVSVPTDCDAQKVRCCRYRVLDHATQRHTAKVSLGYAEYDEDDDSDCAY